MPSTCVFEFDRPDPVYYSGEIINGRIQLTTTSEKDVREVYIAFEGESKVRWEERKTRKRDGKTQHYTEYYRGNENWINTRTNVFGEGVLPPGTHVYTFSIPIPLQCPTSCVEKYGHISYELSLVLNRKLRFDNVYKQPLSVIRQYNLNYNPEFLIPVVNEDIKHFCCWPCSSGPVISNLTIPFGAYAPGQKIKYELQIDNQSSKYDLYGIKLEFEQTYQFTAQSPYHKVRYHSNTLAETRQNERVLRLSKRVLTGELSIPPIPPTSQDNGIILLSYSIKMYIKTGDCHTDAEIQIPITIGTTPLAQSATDPSHVQIIHNPSAPDMPPTPGTPFDSPPSYDVCKPPSFEEATTIGGHFIDTDKDEHNRIEGFIPKYPMYTNFAEPTAPPSGQNDDMPNELSGATPQAPLLQSHNQTNTQAPPPYPVEGFDLAGGRMPPPLPQTAADGYGWK